MSSYPFDLNRFFKAIIIKMDNRVRPPNLIQREFDECQKEINSIIDRLGNASAKAQQLHVPVTSSSRLAQSDHVMYLIKDPEGNGGYGLAIGFLKIGFKKLYVYDKKGEMHEKEPLCILDFYVSEPYQRQGYGKKLYDYMLMTEHVEPADLAIDRPSLKLSSFLKKHYGLSHSIPQTNNFVIFEGFFNNQSQGISDRTEATIGRPLNFSRRKRNGINRICKSAGIYQRTPLNGRSEMESILQPDMIETLNKIPNSSSSPSSPSPLKEKEDYNVFTPPVGRVMLTDTTNQLGGNYLPNIKEPKQNGQCHLLKQTNYSSPSNLIVDPRKHQFYSTPTRKEEPGKNGFEKSQCAPSALANMYSRHMATIGWPQPSQDYQNRIINKQNENVNTIPASQVRNIETATNGAYKKNGQKVCVSPSCIGERGSGGGGGGGEEGYNKTTTTPFRNPSTIRLPAVDNIYQQPKLNVISSPIKWTLFNATPTYASILRRGHSHTRLW